MIEPPPSARRSYARVARLYDWLASGQARRLPAWKADQIDRLSPGQRVLYAGVGPGWDALAAARGGCQVTGIDLAKRMVDRAAARFERAGVAGRFIVGDVADHQPDQPYDVIIANFFYNIFDPATATDLMRACRRMLASDGSLMIADFIKPQAAWPARAIQTINHRLAFGFYAMFGCARWQAMHDYAAIAPGVGLHVLEHLRYRSMRFAPPMYAMMVLVPDG